MSIEVSIFVNNVPAPLLTQFVSEVTVEQSGDGPSRYRLLFESDIARGDYAKVNDPTLQPTILPGIDTNLGVVVTGRAGIYQSLINGPIEDRRFVPKPGGPGSMLEVTGSDKSIVMDRQDKRQCWPGTESLAAVGVLVANGFAPSVEKTFTNYFPPLGSLSQSGSDLSFLRMMARRNGFKFWVSGQVVGVPPALLLVDVGNFRTAPPRFRPPELGSLPPIPQLDLPIIRLNPASQLLPLLCSTTNGFNVQSNTEYPLLVQDLRVDENTGAVIPIVQPRNPAVSAFFGVLAPEAVVGPRFPLPTLQFASPGGPGEAYARAEAAMDESGFFVRASAETTKDAIDTIVEPNTFVRVEGVGGQNQGQYWVRSVTHTIDSDSHRMSMNLERNAQGIGI